MFLKPISNLESTEELLKNTYSQAPLQSYWIIILYGVMLKNQKNGLKCIPGVSDIADWHLGTTDPGDLLRLHCYSNELNSVQQTLIEPLLHTSHLLDTTDAMMNKTWSLLKGIMGEKSHKRVQNDIIHSRDMDKILLYMHRKMGLIKSG